LPILLQNYEQSNIFQKTVNSLILLTEIRKNYRSPSGMFFKSKNGLPQNETHFAAAHSNIFYYEAKRVTKQSQFAPRDHRDTANWSHALCQRLFFI
jgi:hypothetical protein